MAATAAGSTASSARAVAVKATRLRSAVNRGRCTGNNDGGSAYVWMVAVLRVPAGPRKLSVTVGNNHHVDRDLLQVLLMPAAAGTIVRFDAAVESREEAMFKGSF